MSIISRSIMCFGSSCRVSCDANCGKAWGINNRPIVQLSEDEDDTIYLSDHELGDAPADPGTYEGGSAKPRSEDQKLNKWCARECERSVITDHDEAVVLPDFTVRIRNVPLDIESA